MIFFGCRLKRQLILKHEFANRSFAEEQLANFYIISTNFLCQLLRPIAVEMLSLPAFIQIPCIYNLIKATVQLLGNLGILTMNFLSFFAEAQIEKLNTACTNCKVHFPTCVATGLSIVEASIWSCKVCKHPALRKKMELLNACPLCHAKQERP
ncbi:hypothetical protein HUJ04_012403 [Dendroctonus ponderosae]|nr:hypothetical protein HUJ04_012403 [Dendroctonus ponderosae]